MTIVKEEIKIHGFRKTIVNYIDKQTSTMVGLKDKAIKHFRLQPALCGHDEL